MPKVLVVGDFISDINCHCEVTRLCPEAPAPVLIVVSKDVKKGGAGLVYDNLLSLGSGKSYDSLFPSGSEKTRFFVGHHLLFRVDRDSYKVDPPSATISRLSNLLEKKPDAIVISDYGKGGITLDVAGYLISTKIPVFVDTKGKNPLIYDGAYAVFPNEAELSHWIDRQIKVNAEHMITKLGFKGCYVDGKLVPTEPQQVYDVTGAGDVFLAAFVHRWLEFRDVGQAGTPSDILIECAKFANRAAGISVRHLGTYVVKRKEVYDSP